MKRKFSNLRKITIQKVCYFWKVRRHTSFSCEQQGERQEDKQTDLNKHNLGIIAKKIYKIILSYIQS